MARNLDNSNLLFPQDERISFQEDGHIYMLDGERQLTSVSNVYSQYFTPFDSDKFALKKATVLGKDPYELIEDWDRNGKRASFAGTHLHKQIEEYLNGDEYMAPNCLFEYNGAKHKYSEIINIEKEIELFKKFVKEVKFTPFRTEWRVFDEKLGIAGTIDLVARCDDGTFELFDWKRSKTLIDNWGYECKTNKFRTCGINGLEHVPDCSYWHYALQQNLYKYILETCYGLKISAMHLVVLHCNYNKYHVINMPTMPFEVEIIVNNLLCDN